LAGAELDFVGPEAYTILGALFKKRMQNYGYKIKVESEYLCRIKKEITTNYKFKKPEMPQTSRNLEK
jgi:hypothetical protein